MLYELKYTTLNENINYTTIEKCKSDKNGWRGEPLYDAQPSRGRASERVSPVTGPAVIKNYEP